MSQFTFATHLFFDTNKYKTKTFVAWTPGKVSYALTSTNRVKRDDLQIQFFTIIACVEKLEENEDMMIKNVCFQCQTIN